MRSYKKISIEGDVFYREYRTTVSDEWLTEEELIEQLLEEAVKDEVEIDEYAIRHVLNRLTDEEDRQMLQDYIRYLEHMK